ncbi:YihY/virulence factor BrkB family protein [Myxococcus stipitatus]|uniref:YihY/virulence factor BrkB family protein n=1 Tax=Myxococcus stipitatus TaxID=83455 RepID=UPI0030CFFFA8
MVFPGNGMGWKEFFKRLKDEWKRDDVSNVAGALTFRAILALFPFLLFLVSLAGVIIDPKQAQVLIGELGKVAPKEVTSILGQRIESLADSNPVGLLTVGGVGAIWAASGGIVALMDALNTAYGVEETRPVWKLRLIAVTTTLMAAVVTIVAALAAVVTPALASRLPGPVSTVAQWLRLPVAGLLMMFLWAVLYYVLPDARHRFRFITPGAVVGVVIWVVASWGFSKYVANFGKYDVNYGAIGGVIVLLLWMWLSSQVVLLGAEINAILEQRSPEGRSAPRQVDAPIAEDRGELSKTPLAAATKWAAGLGLGVFFLRRGSGR